MRTAFCVLCLFSADINRFRAEQLGIARIVGNNDKRAARGVFEYHRGGG